MSTPKQYGYHFPAEWEPHEATWFSYPHARDTWPETVFPSMLSSYHHFIAEISHAEKVHIITQPGTHSAPIIDEITHHNAALKNIVFHEFITDDAWIRDHGPAFVVNPSSENKKAIIDWQFNAWGKKYPYHHDNAIPSHIAHTMNYPTYRPSIIMEGGSVDFNGIGDVLTTTSCLLNKNRNPQLSQDDIEDYLKQYYGVRKVHWLDEGIAGDDTDGHIDDITRFVSEDTVLTAIEDNNNDPNFEPLKKNRATLATMRLHNRKKMSIIDLPMPDPVIFNNQRLPASYANFYISNDVVIVPTFRCKKDTLALDIIETCFPTRRVIGIDATDIIIGLGSFHCLSQQEPAI